MAQDGALPGAAIGSYRHVRTRFLSKRTQLTKPGSVSCRARTERGEIRLCVGDISSRGSEGRVDLGRPCARAGHERGALREAHRPPGDGRGDKIAREFGIVSAGDVGTNGNGSTGGVLVVEEIGSINLIFANSGEVIGGGD